MFGLIAWLIESVKQKGDQQCQSVQSFSSFIGVEIAARVSPIWFVAGRVLLSKLHTAKLNNSLEGSRPRNLIAETFDVDRS